VSTSTPTRSRALSAPRAAPGGLREVFDLAYPVVLTQLSATAMGVVDSAMVGRLGATQLGAVGFGAIWLWPAFSLFHGTATGVQTFVSQEDGAGRPARCGSWPWQALYVLLPVSALAALVAAPFVAPVLAVLGPSSELQSAASTYVVVRLPGEVGFVALMVLTSFFRGLGDTRTPLYVTLGANAVNAVLDYGLIFGRLGLPAWGVPGAALATVVANTIGALALLALFLRRPLRERHGTAPVAPCARTIRRFLRTGAPIGGQWCIGMSSFAVFTTFVARMGDTSMAASQALVMLLSLSFMQAIGISVAASTLVGRYVGAGDEEAVRHSFDSSMILGVGLAGIVAVLFVAVPGPLLGLFSDDPAVAEIGRPLLLIGAIYQLCDAVAIIADGGLRGAGDTRWPFVLETALGWGVFLPLAWLLGVALEGGLTGAWIGGLFSLGLLALLLVRRFRSGAWRTIRI
jgi:MATE family multidrug resistance protein